MKINIECPNGRYDSEMRIICSKDNEPCAFQYYRTCKGWWVLTDGAETCLRRVQKDGAKADKGRKNRV